MCYKSWTRTCGKPTTFRTRHQELFSILVTGFNTPLGVASRPGSNEIYISSNGQISITAAGIAAAEAAQQLGKLATHYSE